MPVLAKDLKVGDKLTFDHSYHVRPEWKGRTLAVQSLRSSRSVTMSDSQVASDSLRGATRDVAEPQQQTDLGRLVKREFEPVEPVEPVLKSTTVACHQIAEDVFDAEYISLGPPRVALGMKEGDGDRISVWINDPLVLRALIDDLTVLHGRMVDALGSETLAGAK